MLLLQVKPLPQAGLELQQVCPLAPQTTQTLLLLQPNPLLQAGLVLLQHV
jgi:hypothetical protein